jgi:hypothetical protein
MGIWYCVNSDQLEVDTNCQWQDWIEKGMFQMTNYRLGVSWIMVYVGEL